MENWDIAEEIWQNAYQGTAGSISNAVEEYEDEHGLLPMKVFSLIDNLGFDCVGCGWVCEISELSDYEEEMLCKNCAENE